MPLKEIADRLDEHERDVREYRVQQAQLTGMVFQQLENIENKLEDIAKDLTTLNTKVKTYDGWVTRAKGALWPIGVAAMIIWWLIKDKVETFFGVGKGN